METKTKNSPTTSSSPKPKRTRLASHPYSAQEKAQAILAVWTERCKPAEVCREMNVNWMTFNHWQQRAMEGMLQALESRVNLARGEVLSPRLQALLLNRQKAVSTRKLVQRLEQIQLAKPPEPAAQTP
jgi:transposase-like protein